ncbi:choice-of-anchor A family protein [Hyalangium versicolor]|uniref:choice-of-anchor A family protein n=1 Tax=Hyalangium versicolor TaxID=2861190 RepID=UPI001CC90D31|nr:choice-of-anchor A family protein [Hyalangium versicolor]
MGSEDEQGPGAGSSNLDDNGACSPDSSVVPVHLNDYNLFLLGDYTLGTDVEGKVAAAGNITMDNFSVGWRLPATDIANTLVAGGNLTLTHGGVWGDAWHGGSYSADQSVVYSRGAVSQGAPIDFAARGTELVNLSAQLASQTANGTTTRESWGGLMLRGTSAWRNIFDVNASDFTGAKLWSIDAPAGSFVVVNIHGASATFGGFATQFSGGIDQHGVLYNFVDTTSITAEGFGFWGTVLAPFADIHFTNGSFDGGIYAKSLTGNAEGHINALAEHTICQPPPPPTDGGTGGETPDGGSGGETPDGGNGGGPSDGGTGGPSDGGSGGGTPDGGHGGNDGGCPDGGHDHGGGGGGHHDGDGCPNGGHDHGGGGHHDGDGCPNGGHDHGGGGGGGGHHDGDGCPNGGHDHGGGGGGNHGGGGGGHHDGDGCPNGGHDHGGGGGGGHGGGGGGGGHHDGDGCPNGGHDHGGGGGGGGHGGGGGGSGGHHNGDGCPNGDHNHGGGGYGGGGGGYGGNH